MILNQMRIGMRLSMGFAIVIALAAALAATALYQLNVLSRAVDQVTQYNEAKGNLVNQLDRATLERAIAARNLLHLTDAAGRKVQLDQIAQAKLDIDKNLSALESLIRNSPNVLSADLKSLEAALSLEERYWPVAQKIVKASNEGRPEEAVSLLLEDCIPLLAELKQGLGAFVANSQQQQDQTLAEMRGNTSLGEASIWILSLVALVVGSTLAWAITRSVVKPLQVASQALRELGNGNLSQTIRSEGRDEVGLMMQDLSAMQHNFSQVIGNVRSATDSINTASSEIASGNQDLSARTEQAASNLEETAASMEELTSTVRNSADAARQANQLAATASEIAVRGGKVVGEVVTTMEAIDHSSKKISDIISVIDGIAFQTNILALNAAVEAARAGEQGRGFAVVASEVRSLAQRSAEAAKEIKGLIGTSVDKVEAGSRLVADAGQTMSEIVGSVQRVSDIIGEITAAAGEQSDGIGQVNVAVNQLDQMTQQNAALVEQSAAAAESLKDQANRLAQVIQIFKLDGAVPVIAQAPVRELPPPVSKPVSKPVLVKPAVVKAATQGTTPPKAAPGPAPALKRPAPAMVSPQSTKVTASASAEGDWESF